jgi:hypothetical protein
MSDDPRDYDGVKTRTRTRRTPWGSITEEWTTYYEENRGFQLLVNLAGALVLVLVLVALFSWVSGLSNRSATETDTQGPILSAPTTAGAAIEIASNNPSGQATSAIPAVPAPLEPAPAGPGPAFSAFYQQRGGVNVLGLPVSAPREVNGRLVQWFERARLEQWPEFAGTPYEVQLGRLGVEFTQAREFPKPAFFPSRPDLRFFPETGHAVAEPFLSYWNQNGGLDVFGYPISEALPENLSDGQVHTVQYFERARFELHGNQVQLGLLGRALYARDRDPAAVATPAIITVPPPSPVPLPLP